MRSSSLSSVPAPFGHASPARGQRRGSILAPGLENLDAIVQETAEAVRYVEQMREILRACADRLPSRDREALECTMGYQAQCVRVWRYHPEAFLRYRLFLRRLPGGDYASLIAACDRCQAEMRRLRPLDEEQADAALARVGRLRSLAWVKACATQMHPKGIIDWSLCM